MVITAHMPHSTGSQNDQNPLRLMILAALQRTGHLPLLDLDVEVDGNIVQLRGRLPSYFLRQLAHRAALSIPGVCEVDDEIEVIQG